MTGNASNQEIRLTVAICTRNPRRDLIEETLAALRRQTLPASRWDLLLVDNGSDPPLDGAVDLAWHPSARVVVASEIGITAARLKAFEAWERGSYLVFVDDDNLLSPDYLEIGTSIGDGNPDFGCWGGQLLPRFEAPPPEWIEPYLKYLAVFPLAHDIVADCFSGNHDVLPPTAGMFLRREVADAHAKLLCRDARHASLGPKGFQRIGGEDSDLAHSALKAGFKLARLRALSLTHVISAARMEIGYLSGLIRGIKTGGCLLEYLWEGKEPTAKGPLERAVARWRIRRLPSPLSEFYRAECEGEAQACRIIQTWR